MHRPPLLPARLAAALAATLLAACTTSAASPPAGGPLAGTAWRVTGYGDGGAVVPVREGTRITLEFNAQGGVRGSGGCNTYSGGWSDTDGRLEIGPLRTTRMACVDPLGRMQQEAAYLRALQAAASARRDGDRLELRTATGTVAVTASASPP